MPQTSGGEEAVGVFGSSLAVDVEERADGPVLVVLTVRLLEIAFQVGRQVQGILLRAEACESEAVALTGEAQLAGEKQVTQHVSEVLTAVHTDQPGSGEAGVPFALQEDFEFLSGDRLGG